MHIVSVIIPTYNSGKFIKRALDSILIQEGIGIDFKIEIIIVDDCSNDNTLKYIEDYQIKVLSTEENSGGPNKGRNIGLKEAQGNYICFMDHDDEWLPNKLKKQLALVNKAPVVTCGYYLVDEQANRKTERCNSSNNGFLEYSKNETFLKRLAKDKRSQETYFGSILFHKSLKNILFEEYFGKTDFEWVLDIFHQNNSVEVSEPLYNRYVNGTNLSLNHLYRKIDYYYSLFVYERFENEYKDTVKKGIKRLNGSRARYFYLIGNMSQARKYFRKSELNFKIIMYYVTTYYGHTFVKRKFNIFG